MRKESNLQLPRLLPRPVPNSLLDLLHGGLMLVLQFPPLGLVAGFHLVTEIGQ